MPANKNALLRYKTIDNCLRNRFRRWTLEDLVNACSDALYEFEGIRKGVSVRTIQGDLQMMRSDKIGYNAPIEVYDGKYYRYANKDYSIMNLPLSQHDYEVLNEAVQMLRQFEDFGYFAEMSDVIGRLQDSLAISRGERQAIVDFERNPNLTGLKFLNPLYNYIAHRQTIQVIYKPFKRTKVRNLTVFPYLLKEFNNRWFLFCSSVVNMNLYTLALDRIQSVEVKPDVNYVENSKFNPATYFKDMIGVTRGDGTHLDVVRFKASAAWAPYIETKPIHASQWVVERDEETHTVTFEVKLILNEEFYAQMLSYGSGVRILSPHCAVKKIKEMLHAAARQYEDVSCV